MGWAKRSYDPHGRTHYNTSFINAPQYATQVTDFIAQVNEYATLRAMTGSPLAVSNRNFGMYSTSALERIEAALNTPTPVLEASMKGASFAIRTGEKYGEGRVNLELRAITNNLPDARRVLLNTARFLSDPLRAQLQLGTQGRPYTIDEVRNVDRLSWRTVERLPMGVQVMMGEVGDRMTPGPKTPRKPQVLKLRWSIPMVEWEKRPGMPDEMVARVVEARARYLETLEGLAQRSAQTGPDALARALDSAVHVFARSTQLHQSF